MLSFTRDACPVKYGAICYFVDFSYFCSVVWIVGAVFALVSRPGWLKWHVYKRAKGILSKYIAGGRGLTRANTVSLVSFFVYCISSGNHCTYSKLY